MPIETTLLILVAAFGLDAAFGYPKFAFDRFGHPVTWMGSLIGYLDLELNHDGESTVARRTAGVIALLVTLAVVTLIAWIVQYLLAQNILGQILLAALASTLIASRSLYDHVRDVAVALEGQGLDAARSAVGRIVGRNPEALDTYGVARAAIESLAENASDGVVAPALWFALLGLPGLAAYKAINTADSMIGHRTPRHEAFGWASARLDDLVNLPASRLTGLLFAVGAYLYHGASAGQALAVMWRDASKHRSPNAGWPESAMAGALGLKLNGPKTYGDVHVDDAYMGDGHREATAANIRKALQVALNAWLIMFVVILVAAIIARF